MQGLPLNRGIAGFSGKCGTHFLNTLCAIGSGGVTSVNSGTSALTGVYQVPRGVNALYVRVWGATGGSESIPPSHNVYAEVYESVSCRGGGGGRGYASALLPVSPGAQLKYSIGNAGVYGGVSAGVTSFGNIRVTGGGNASGTTPGTGGVATGGDLNYSGGTGATGYSQYRDASTLVFSGGLGGPGSDLGSGGVGGKSGTFPSYYYGYAGLTGNLGGASQNDGSSGGAAPSRATASATVPAATQNALLRVLSPEEVKNVAGIYRAAYTPKVLALSLGYTLDLVESGGGGIIYLDPIYTRLQ